MIESQCQTYLALSLHFLAAARSLEIDDGRPYRPRSYFQSEKTLTRMLVLLCHRLDYEYAPDAAHDP